MSISYSLPIDIHWQVHTDFWQSACVSTVGTALQPYVKPEGYLNSNAKQLADIWYILIISYNMTDLDTSKRFCKAYPCTSKALSDGCL